MAIVGCGWFCGLTGKGANMGKLVLVMEVHGVPHFWTGYRWWTEYPDAKLYESRRDAVRDQRRFPGSCVIRDYGLETERCESGS